MLLCAGCGDVLPAALGAARSADPARPKAQALQLNAMLLPCTGQRSQHTLSLITLLSHLLLLLAEQAVQQRLALTG